MQEKLDFRDWSTWGLECAFRTKYFPDNWTNTLVSWSHHLSWVCLALLDVPTLFTHFTLNVAHGRLCVHNIFNRGVKKSHCGSSTGTCHLKQWAKSSWKHTLDSVNLLRKTVFLGGLSFRLLPGLSHCRMFDLIQQKYLNSRDCLFCRCWIGSGCHRYASLSDYDLMCATLNQF